MAFLDSIFNPVLLPLINEPIGPFWGLVILALLISLIVTLVYKYFTNQETMKKLKNEQKSMQQKMKELRSNPEEMMKVQKEAMKLNFEYMKHSFKPMLITMLPVLIIFGWMAGHLSYEPIYPQETYSISALFKAGSTGEAQLIVDDKTVILNSVNQTINNGKSAWELKSQEGEHLFIIKYGTSEQNKTVVIGKDFNYAEPVSFYQHSDIERAEINYKKLQPLGDFSLFGWHPGWVGLYIIFSLIFSLGLRKAFSLY